MSEQTRIWCVYHVIHVRTPHQHIPKLVVTDVPVGVEVSEEMLERAGYLFEEFNIPWANHAIAPVDKDAPSDLVARLRAGEGEWLTYSDLLARADAPI